MFRRVDSHSQMCRLCSPSSGPWFHELLVSPSVIAERMLTPVASPNPLVTARLAVATLYGLMYGAIVCIVSLVVDRLVVTRRSRTPKHIDNARDSTPDMSDVAFWAMRTPTHLPNHRRTRAYAHTTRRQTHRSPPTHASQIDNTHADMRGRAYAHKRSFLLMHATAQ